MNLLHPSTTTVQMFMLGTMLLATVLVWLAFAVLLRCRSITTGGRIFVLLWLGHVGIWLGVSLIVKLVFGYNATPLLSMWGMALWIQAALSVIAYVIQWTRQQSANPPKPLFTLSELSQSQWE